MRFTIFILFILPLIAFAENATVDCYDHGKLMYRGIATNISFAENYFYFTDVKTRYSILTNLKCIIKEKDRIF